MGLEGFYGVGLWEIKFLNILVLVIKKVVMGFHNARNRNVMG
jgi:hypothetical protein